MVSARSNPTPSDKVASLLVVEDDLDLAEMLKTYFEAHGFRIQTAADGGEALAACRQNRPDLVLLDIRLPDMDGYEVARRLRSQGRTAALPIIFLTEKSARSDRLQGLGLGAEDYISKPFDIQELRLRVRNALHRSIQPSLTNPVTNLPEGALVDERLQECLQGEAWSMLRISVVHIDKFREKYGFVAADDILRAISLMLRNAVRDSGKATDFIGQFGPSEFVVITSDSSATAIRERLIDRFLQSVDYFYPLEARQELGFADERIALAASQLASHQGRFQNLEALKAALIKG